MKKDRKGTRNDLIKQKEAMNFIKMLDRINVLEKEVKLLSEEVKKIKKK